MTWSCGVGMCTVDLFWGTRKSFNGFETQQAVFVSQTSSKCGEGKGKRSLDQLQRHFWVLPVLAWHFHKGEFHSLWQRLGHYHLCPALWWERCLSRFGSGLLKEKKTEESLFMSQHSANSFKHFHFALILQRSTWPNYRILIFLMCFN